VTRVAVGVLESEFGDLTLASSEVGLVRLALPGPSLEEVMGDLARGFTLAAVPYRTTITYRDLAQRAGNERASRAAGAACATNPVAIVLPCHRVLRTDGGLGGYGGGLELKEALLRLEGIRL
jgi:O-6-methylguanine DNA methyltransferase